MIRWNYRCAGRSDVKDVLKVLRPQILSFTQNFLGSFREECMRILGLKACNGYVILDSMDMPSEDYR